jgi:hypothetical protein
MAAPGNTTSLYCRAVRHHNYNHLTDNKNQVSMKISRTIGILALLCLGLNRTPAQTTKDLMNLVMQDIAVGDRIIELQKNMKQFYLGFNSSEIYSKDLLSIKFSPFIESWDSSQFDYVSENNSYNILISRPDSNLIVNTKIWHCLLSRIFYNSDSTLALMQYSKSIPMTNEKESGTVLYKVRNGKWVRHFVIEGGSIKNSITQ